MFIHYDQERQMLKVIGREEAEEALDPENIDKVYGTGAKAGRMVRSILNKLNATGVKDIDVAAFFGINKSAVSQWRSGRTQPAKEKLGQLEALLEERKATPENDWRGRRPRRQATIKQLSSNYSPANRKGMPKPNSGATPPYKERNNVLLRTAE